MSSPPMASMSSLDSSFNFLVCLSLIDGANVVDDGSSERTR